MIIRVLGTLVGLASIIMSGFMLFEGHEGYASPILSLIIGFIFLVYGIGGSKALLKILPGLVETKIGK